MEAWLFVVFLSDELGICEEYARPFWVSKDQDPSNVEEEDDGGGIRSNCEEISRMKLMLSVEMPFLLRMSMALSASKAERSEETTILANNERLLQRPNFLKNFRGDR
ncbi:hypothetical protein KM043_001267 [Ampulex compressa]|nr:hypothetical protein KM043_001267 [Ampulex compressa]